MTATLTSPPHANPIAHQSGTFRNEQLGRRNVDLSFPTLETHDLTKAFGKATVVDSLDFAMYAGEVLGFLGPNGAGKSTTVSMILGLVHPTRGTITIGGKTLEDHPEVVSEMIGAIIENPAFYPFLTGRENLRAFAMMAGPVDEARIDDLLKMVNMNGRADQKYKTFSLGMKQRLGLAATLLTNPTIVILDEPTNGLDPAGQREIREIIPRLAEEGHSVFLASHLLKEVEQVSDRVAIIQEGKLIRIGTVDELLMADSYFEIRVPASETANCALLLRSLAFVDQVQETEDILRVQAPPDSGAEINRALADADVYASSITLKRQSLEALFLELTESQTLID